MTNDEALVVFLRAALKDGKVRAFGSAIFEVTHAMDNAVRAGRMATGPVAKSGARSHVAWRKHLEATYRMRFMLHTTSACRFFALA